MDFLVHLYAEVWYKVVEARNKYTRKAQKMRKPATLWKNTIGTNTLNCQATKIDINSVYQLSEL